jgi:hypothetical protein
MKLNIKVKIGKTIRDATQQEVMAWHILQSVVACDLMPCANCYANDGAACVCDMLIYYDSEDLLKGKEIILNMVE